MVDLQELQNDSENHLYYNLCLKIQQNINQNPQESLEFLERFIIPISENIHPQTLFDTIFPLSNILSPESSLSLIQKSLEILISRNNYKKLEQLYIKYKIKEHECLLYLKQKSDTEAFIYSLLHPSKIRSTSSQNTLFGPELVSRLQAHEYTDRCVLQDVYFLRLCYRYFEGIGVYDKSFHFLWQYISKKHSVDSYTDSKENLALKMVRYSLLTRNWFFLDKVYNHELFSCLKDANYRSLFISVKDGKFSLISTNKNNIVSMFGDKYTVIEEKAFLIAIYNLCYAYRNRDLSISEITSTLKISRNTALNFLVRALGLGLITGKIDGTSDVIKLKSVYPKTLNEDEIIQIANEVGFWRKKVQDTLKSFD